MAKKKSSNTRLTNSALVTAIALIVIGILFCIFRTKYIGWLFTVIGIVLIVLGIYDAVVRKQLVIGIVEAVVGVLLIVSGWKIIEITLVVFGVVLIVYGIFMLIQNLAHLKSYKKGIDRLFAILKPIIIIVVGILLVVSRWVMLDWFMIVIGVIAVIEGILMLVK